MSIYFIEANGLTKIGFSDDPKRRIAQIFASYPGEARLLGVMPGDRDLEQHFHAKFSEHRCHGEWFRPSPDLSRLIDEFATQDVGAKRRTGNIVAAYSDKYSEESADCLDAFVRHCGEGEDAAFAAIEEYCGISIARLRKIHSGEAEISAAEYTICRAFGEGCGFHPAPGERLRELEQAILAAGEMPIPPYRRGSLANRAGGE